MDFEQYADIAEKTGVFRLQEIQVLKEIITDYSRYPGKNYFFLDEQQNGETAGFVIFGKTPLTEYTWDIYWLVVDPAFKRRGIAGLLLDRVTQFILEKKERFIIRVETSSSEKYQAARDFYARKGFIPGGRIPDFYAKGDDLMIYYLNTGAGEVNCF